MSNELEKIYLDHIQINDLTEDMQAIAEEVGIKNTLKIIELFSGLDIYVPLLKGITRKARDRVICKEHYEQNYSFNELTKRHKISKVSIRQIIRDNQPEE